MEEKLKALGEIWFNPNHPKKFWTEEDLVIVYEIYSSITGTLKKDVGCRSCRRSTINFLKNYYLQMKK